MKKSIQCWKTGWLLILVSATLLVACSVPPVATEPSAAPATPLPAVSSTPISATLGPPTVAPTAAPAPTLALPTLTPAPTAQPPTPASPTQPSTPVPPTATPVPPTAAPPTSGSEILFLREGALMAYALDSQAERLIAAGVSDFAATPNGRLLAVTREGEIWLVARDGGAAMAITANEQIESGLAFAPDGLSLAYVASSLPPPRPFERLAWAEWCRVSEVRLLEMSGGERSIGPGCDVAFAPDGKRLAYASPPASGAPQTASNEVRMVNQAGANGWVFASSIGPEPERGLLVYAPSFAPDGGELAYQRYMGNQVESEIVYMQSASIFKGGGDMLGLGVGWLSPLRYAPIGPLAAVVEYNEDDARGASGYEVWRTTVIQRGAPGSVVAPAGSLATTASEVGRLPLAAGAAWSPDGTQLVVLLPTGWIAGPPNADFRFANTEPGALHLWRPGQNPEAALVLAIDYASPLLWLPAS